MLISICCHNLKDVVQRYKPHHFSDGEWDRDSQEWKSVKSF